MAGANPPLWRDIFVSNREAIVRELDAYAAALETVRERLRAGDGEALKRWIEDARADRQRLLEGELAGGPVSELRVPVPNQPGIVAQIALALSEAGINIVDMALYPAPDMRSGAIALWVAGEGSAERAAELVADLGYAASPVDGGDRVIALRSGRRAGRRARGRLRTSRSRIAPRSWERCRTAACGCGGTCAPRTRPPRWRPSAALGARLVDAQPRGAGLDLELAGAGLRGADPGAAAIDVGNAGTLIRLLPGWLAGQPRGRWALQGDDSIARRPVDRVVHPLRRMGATVDCREGGLPPMVVEGSDLHGIEYELPVASAQVKSCVLLAGLLADGETTVVEPAADPRPHRDHASERRRRRAPGRTAGSPSARSAGWSWVRWTSRGTSPRPRSSSPRRRWSRARR